MKIINHLGILKSCLRRWETAPAFADFKSSLYDPAEREIATVFDDAQSYYSTLEDLVWSDYRARTLDIDPAFEEARVHEYISKVENFFGLKLEGEAVLFGAFECMDGYARFDQGTHRVFLGVDERHGKDKYLDILIAHELTHVARESRPEVWQGFGLDPKMTHDEFTENQPVIEHVIGEGYSCLVSQLLVPDQPVHEYVFQTAESLQQVIDRGLALDREIHQEVAHPDGDYGKLYRTRRYGPGTPQLAHYVWAWQFASYLAKRHGAQAMVGRCSKDWIADALKFTLPTSFHK